MLLVTLSTAATLFVATPDRTPTAPTDLRPCVAAADAVNPYLASARHFVTSGDLDAARREYRLASHYERDNGCLPEATANELATVLMTLDRAREAATIMHELADDAERTGDVNIEARARVAAAWLLVHAGDRAAAAPDVRRLHAIADAPQLTGETRRLLARALK
jgi:hypothetical protein